MFSFEKNRTDSQFRNKLVYFRKGKLIEVYSGMIVKLCSRNAANFLSAEEAGAVCRYA